MLTPGWRLPESRTYPPCCRQRSAAAQEGPVGHQHGRCPFRPRKGVFLVHKINARYAELGAKRRSSFFCIEFGRLA